METLNSAGAVEIGECLLTIQQVMAKTAMSESTIYKYMSLGRFPQPRKFDSKIVRWLSSEIDAWMASLPKAEYLAPPPGASAPTPSGARRRGRPPMVPHNS